MNFYQMFYFAFMFRGHLYILGFFLPTDNMEELQLQTRSLFTLQKLLFQTSLELVQNKYNLNAHLLFQPSLKSCFKHFACLKKRKEERLLVSNKLQTLFLIGHFQPILAANSRFALLLVMNTAKNHCLLPTSTRGVQLSSCKTSQCRRTDFLRCSIPKVRQICLLPSLA